MPFEEMAETQNTCHGCFQHAFGRKGSPEGPREQKRLDRIQREFVLWAQGELENLPDMRPEECYCGYSILFVFIYVYSGRW